ncbi:hypothetical protein DRQ17_07570 [bacterium]|nr:MAG: hypothetical protein DRQ17_07570 [bacterium]
MLPWVRMEEEGGYEHASEEGEEVEGTGEEADEPKGFFGRVARKLRSKKARRIKRVLRIALIGGLVLYGLFAAYSYHMGELKKVQVEKKGLEERIGTLEGVISEMESDKRKVEVWFRGLKRLEMGHYELWVSMGTGREERNVSMGVFNFNEAGTLTYNRGHVRSNIFTTHENISDAREIFVTIEEEWDPDPGPSNITVMRGRIVDGEANLSFPYNKSLVSGYYVIEVMSMENPSINYYSSGIWFGNNRSEILLNLPEAPTGWIYQGRIIVNDSIYLDMGRFKRVDSKDDSNRFVYDPELVPDFPGEDYIYNREHVKGVLFPVNLTDGKKELLITLEPWYWGRDPTGEGPFFIEIVRGNIPIVPYHTMVPVTVTYEKLPYGTARIGL